MLMDRDKRKSCRANSSKLHSMDVDDNCRLIVVSLYIVDLRVIV